WLGVCHVWVGGWQWGQIGYGVAMGVLARVGMKLWGRGRELRNEANGTQLQEPSSAPDFTSLNNGGEPWKNLERLE
ncbi:MAG TPA: hypothetical protein VHP11_12640, partial [Tepidisphaeraceae bacterium]|nr:hypothetical protein [Tepidisphaeraceae bacterium]